MVLTVEKKVNVHLEILVLPAHFTTFLISGYIVIGNFEITMYRGDTCYSVVNVFVVVLQRLLPYVQNIGGL